MTLGETLTGHAQMVRPDLMHVWATVLRDPNPIHTDVEAVRARGLGDRVINQGPGNIAYITNMLLAAFPGGALTHVKVRFLDNVFGGELVTPSAVVQGIEETAEGRRISFKIALHADGRLALDGEAAVLAPPA